MSGLFGAGSSTAASSATNASQGDLKQDVALKDPPEDSISSLAWSPTADYLAVGSWDKKCRIYEVDSNGNSKGLALIEHEAPVLDVAWSKDGRYVFSAGAEGKAKMLDTQNPTNPAQQVAAHDNAIRCIETYQSNGMNILITGSWDKTIRYWNLQQQTPIGTVQVAERVYTMSISQQLLVVGTADRWIEVFNMANPNTVYKKIQSPLKWQTRTVACFPDATGYAVGSIEGRCAIQYVEEKDSSSNFSFKCHRTPDPTNRDIAKVYSVNAISFHPQHGTFSTAGSDGTYHFWDKDAKHRLKGYPEVGGSITATAFNRTGSIFAYTVSYDWSQGYAKNTPQHPNKVMLHPVGPDECKPRPSVKKR